MAGGRARPLASNSEPRREFNGLAGLLVFATKPTRRTAVKMPSRGGTGVDLGRLTEVTGIGGQGGMGVERRLGPLGGQGGNGV